MFRSLHSIANLQEPSLLESVAMQNVGKKSNGSCHVCPNNQSHTESEMAITSSVAIICLLHSITDALIVSKKNWDKGSAMMLNVHGYVVAAVGMFQHQIVKKCP